MQTRFTTCVIDPNIYIKCVSIHFVLLGFYVDDSILANDDEQVLQGIKGELSNAFEMIDIGPIEFCFWIQVSSNITDHSIHLS